MRINSPESIRRARLALEKYGSYDNIKKEGRIRSNMFVARTPLRMVSRPSIGTGFNGIQFMVQFIKDDDHRGFFVISGEGIGVNGENLDNRGHMISEETVRRKGLFRKAIYTYLAYMRNNADTRAFAEEAQAAWDKHKDDIEKGLVEVLVCLPTPAEGNDTRGYGKGSVIVQPTAEAKAEAGRKR